jgi:WS/DGAT/MGAT family acyltransferase
MGYEKLSALDAAFLYMERGCPHNIGALAVFEGGPLLGGDGELGLAAIRSHFSRRARLVPRFSKRLVTVPFGLGHPVLVDDATFDPADHIHSVRVGAPGGDVQLNQLMARLHADPLDRGRPLWEMWIVTGVADGRVAVIEKFHHALVDGISAIQAARVLLNPEEFEPDMEPRSSRSDPPHPVRLAASSLGGLVAGPAKLMSVAASGLAQPTRSARTAAAIARSTRAALKPAAPTPFDVAVGAKRCFETFSVDLARINAVKRAVRCTSNDVVLAIVSGGLRQYFAATGDTAADRPLRAMVPVSTRRSSQRHGLGNQVSAVFPDLPVHLADPSERVRAINAEMSHLKQARHAQALAGLLSAAEAVPAPLYAAASTQIGTRQTSARVVVTHVPGPRSALHLNGARLLDLYAYLGPVENFPLMVAVMRYDGRMSFGLAADPEAVPNTPMLADLMEKSAVETLETASAPSLSRHT